MVVFLSKPGDVYIYSCAAALYTARSSINPRTEWPVELPTAAAKAMIVMASVKILSILASPMDKQRDSHRSNKTEVQRRDLQHKD
jgi:hypothetical protein